MDKLDGLKAGDHVRVSFDGIVSNQSDVVYGAWGVLVAEGHKESNAFMPEDLCAPSFRIERIEKPLAVGDRVVPSQPSHCYGEILAISGDKAWVFWEHNNTHVTLNVTDIVRRPEYRA